MRKFAFENLRGNGKIIEVFGLPKAGKSFYIQERAKEGKKTSDFENLNALNKVLLFLKYAIKHLFSTAHLFYKLNSNWLKMPELRWKDYFLIWRMRNSYLCAVLGKYEYLRNYKIEAYVDEYIMQSLFMIFHKKVDRNEIKKTMRMLPQNCKIIVIEEDKEKRYERWKKIKNPARKLNLNFRMKWWGINEKNYEIIKKILKENYKTL
jgi:hypothetical protein